MSKHGCHNREPFKPTLYVGDRLLQRRLGKSFERVVVLKEIPFRMARDCQYTKSDLGKTDIRCEGCHWKEKVGNA